MTEELKRWDIEADCTVEPMNGSMYPQDDGDYVLYSDHKAVVEGLMGLLKNCHTQECVDYAVKTAMNGSGYHCIAKCSDIRKERTDGE